MNTMDTYPASNAGQRTGRYEMDKQAKKIEAYAAKYGMVLCDYSDLDMYRNSAAEGWTFVALFKNEYECDPLTILVKSPRHEGFQSRPVGKEFPAGMFRSAEINKWIRANAA